MTPQEAINVLEKLKAVEGQWIINGHFVEDAIAEAIKALELKADLIKEIPTFEEVIEANYEIFKKYSIYNHTEIEDIAFSNFDKTVQNLQWLIGEL